MFFVSFRFTSFFLFPRESINLLLVNCAVCWEIYFSFLCVFFSVLLFFLWENDSQQIVFDFAIYMYLFFYSFIDFFFNESKTSQLCTWHDHNEHFSISITSRYFLPFFFFSHSQICLWDINQMRIIFLAFYWRSF